MAGLNLQKCDLTLALAATLQNVLSDDGTVNDVINLTKKIALTNGTGANKAQIPFHTKRILATNTDETLDLYALAGSVGAVFGTYKFTKVKAVIIINESTNTGYRLEYGAADGNQFVGPLKAADDIAPVAAGGFAAFVSPIDGWTVDATHKDIKFNNPSGGNVAYRLIVIGEGTLV